MKLFRDYINETRAPISGFCAVTFNMQKNFKELKYAEISLRNQSTHKLKNKFDNYEPNMYILLLDLPINFLTIQKFVIVEKIYIIECGLLEILF